MRWKAIGQSVIGTSHTQSGKACEDAINYAIVKQSDGNGILLCCVSDGAGSAKFAAEASAFITSEIIKLLAARIEDGYELNDAALFEQFDILYDAIVAKATERNEPLNEFSCTLLGCIIYPGKAVFFQTGDGAIIRDDGTGNYVAVWWPQNGEYSNTTNFFIDDSAFSNIKILVINEAVHEVGIFTDGLQMLALNNEAMNVHQPFFTGMFKWLRKAKMAEEIGILDKKLGEYLSGRLINSRTDDDKTLFLATILNDE
jgi:hypothetical protein